MTKTCVALSMHVGVGCCLFASPRVDGVIIYVFFLAWEAVGLIGYGAYNCDVRSCMVMVCVSFVNDKDMPSPLDARRSWLVLVLVLSCMLSGVLFSHARLRR
eukprot:TRINITY_DN357_c0_g1_i2.p2 TRINITY_DN357_c0_g1~~TRINITY_DN357_c0_g1_i2.p2  ORF type:complete len:102 (+),score=7.81 TRINITY_DN357_c0_g1_i2:80-385(+)